MASTAAAATRGINFANMKYISTSREKGGGIRHLRGKLRYFQYRNDKSDHIPHPRGKAPRRWQDHGLGSNYGEIMQACQDLQSKNVLAWTWVISPNPELMALVPEETKRDLLRDLTETVVGRYYEARGVDDPRYSYVMHDRDTADGEQQLHTHVVLPGTVQTIEGPQPFFNNENKGHVELFNGIADQEFAAALDRTIGLDWRALLPAPEALLEAEPEETAQPSPKKGPLYPEGKTEIERWFGPRDARPDFKVPPEFDKDSPDLDL